MGELSMLDHQQLVDEIRSFLAAHDATVTTALKELSAAYVDACKLANQKLRRCGDFLKRGLTSEALQLAKDEKLLDLVATLDFVELPQWGEVSRKLGLLPPPRLLLETAEALDKAHADQRPMDELMRRHRLFALARAPVTARLGIMRKLAAIDAKNRVWEEDITEFEKKRFREIQYEADQALARDDGKTLTGLWKELHQTTWAVTPPPPLLQSVSRRLLEKLEVEIHDAFTAQAVTKLQRLRDQWKELIQATVLPASDPLMRRPARALAWLEEREKELAVEVAFQKAVADLEQALDNNLKENLLEEYRMTALRHRPALPAAVEQRFQLHIKEIKKDRRKGRWETLLAVSVAPVGIVGVAALLFFLMKREEWIYLAPVFVAGSILLAVLFSKVLRNPPRS